MLFHPDLLLRSDLHTLFDLDLVGINPDTMTVHIAPALRGTAYEEFDRKALAAGRMRPSRDALALRRKAFTGDLGPSAGPTLTAANETKETADV